MALFDEDTINAVSKLSVAVVAIVVLGFLFYNQMDYTANKVDAIDKNIQSIQSSDVTIMQDHQELKRDVGMLKDALLLEATKQTILQQKMCVRQSRTNAQASDCLSINP